MCELALGTGMSLESVGQMPESDFAALMAYGSEMLLPWQRLELMLQRIAWMIGMNTPGMPKDIEAYGYRTSESEQTDVTEDSADRLAQAMEFSPVNLKRRPADGG